MLFAVAYSTHLDTEQVTSCAFPTICAQSLVFASRRREEYPWKIGTVKPHVAFAKKHTHADRRALVSHSTVSVSPMLRVTHTRAHKGEGNTLLKSFTIA